MNTKAEIKSLLEYWRNRKAETNPRLLDDVTEPTEDTATEKRSVATLRQIIGPRGDRSPVNETTFEHDPNDSSGEASSDAIGLAGSAFALASESEVSPPAANDSSGPPSVPPSPSLGGVNNESPAPATPKGGESNLLTNLGDLTNIDTERTDHPAFNLPSHIQTDTVMADIGDSDEKSMPEIASSTDRSNQEVSPPPQDVKNDVEAESNSAAPAAAASDWPGVLLIVIATTALVAMILTASFFWRLSSS